MIEPLFSKMIICKQCNKRHKTKLIRGKSRIYIDSTYDNKGKLHCDRNLIQQNFILELLHFRFPNIKDPIELSKKVSIIYVNKGTLQIEVTDGEPIISTETFLQL